jgi:hypothetical protein
VTLAFFSWRRKGEPAVSSRYTFFLALAEPRELSRHCSCPASSTSPSVSSFLGLPLPLADCTVSRRTRKPLLPGCIQLSVSREFLSFFFKSESFTVLTRSAGTTKEPERFSLSL